MPPGRPRGGDTQKEPMTQKILVVEDEVDLALGVRDALAHAGFQAEVVHDGRGALAELTEHPYDLCVLDLMLPGLNGLDLLRELRKQGKELRVLILTALADEEDLLKGFEAGADDYMAKPFSPRELVARVEAQFRRRAIDSAPPPRLDLPGGITVDLARLEVHRNGELITLTPREGDILEYLVRNRDRVVTREDLLARRLALQERQRRDAHGRHPHRRPAPQGRARSGQADADPDGARQGLPLVQLRTERTALALYGVLLVLPTIVLGGLQWHQIVQEKQDELAAVPRTAEDGARRFKEMAVDVVERLLADESQRPFHHYAAFYCPETAAGDEVPLLPSPLVREQRPSGLLCWFVADVTDEERGEVQLFFGAAREVAPELAEELAAAAEHLIENDRGNERLRRLARLGEFREEQLSLRSVAANRARLDDRECLQEMPRFLYENIVELLTSEFSLKFFRDDQGLPRIVATRQIVMDDMPALIGMNECLHRLTRGLGLIQGFFIDPQWLFETLPASVARTVLDEAQHFVPSGAEQCCEGREEYNAEIRLVDALGIEVEHPGDRDFGLMHVAVDTLEVEARFGRRSQRFFGMAAMLALSLGTGMVLLLRSVRSDLEQAERTENFVDAVTHELRTPLSAIKLHGEMLLDGWVSDAEKQKTTTAASCARPTASRRWSSACSRRPAWRPASRGPSPAT